MLTMFRMTSFMSFVLVIIRYIFIPDDTFYGGFREPTVFEEYRCPTQALNLTRYGQCEFNSEGGYSYHPDEALNETIRKCAEMNASPIIIRNANDQTHWFNVYSSHRCAEVLGIRCNYSTSKWQWVDGSAITYKPSHYDGAALDRNCSNLCPGVFFIEGDVWKFNCSDKYRNYQTFCVNCISDLPRPKITKECSEFENYQNGSVCYQVMNTHVNWTVANKFCKSIGASLASIHNEQDNVFLRSLAYSRGILNGMQLGASSSAKLDDFKWIDGSVWNYTNFVPGFPIRGLGNCLSMATNGVDGQWTNGECSTKMPFACSRKAFAEGASKKCPGGNVTEGEIIVSPGFPVTSSIPCDFFLTVPTGKLIEVEIITLEANSCCDFLVLTEGPVGGALVANLTGAVGSVTYKTTSMNIMKVSWQPRGGVNVRGLVMTFRAV
ncbi:hypothetical protein PMAYCL1PPCAC_25966 [Pristionchus mayeri]|uniref:C-type lectin n=1 Tax=Pristionchus mayeri TaxID=1317129 RepID=A0AAN5IAC0_9BILA|nr:hypothetical protein PMAYCL1PPCAC_25966 [Pristionchus mayeri]